MADMNEETQQSAVEYRDKPQPDELAKKWKDRVASARTYWDTFHKRVRHNRKTVAGFDWSKDPKGNDFYEHRANLIHGTITAVLPNVYARNPEISVTPLYGAESLKLFCKTIETVTNRSLEKAKIKKRAKASVRAALTSSFGIVKVMYQRDIHEDPMIQSRMNDTQDNIVALEKLIMDVQDEQQRGDLETKKAELEQMMAGLREQVEVVAAEGLVIDRVLTDNLLIDPSVCEFSEYLDADWLCQIIPMKKSAAEALYKIKLDQAKSYEESTDQKQRKDGRLASAGKSNDDDKQIAILEIWDKTTQRVYTMAEGCEYWLRDPYSPRKVGERWYPYFLLPFQEVDGNFVGPSLVDLTEKLQKEHNDARDRYNQHRDLCLPGWVAGGEINEKSIKRFKDSELGEITIIDTEGKPLNQVFQERQHPKIDPLVYDTSAVRYDWEQVTGLQDAARSTVVKPKTATEASIMQQSLSGRVSEFRDAIEDWLQEIAQYSAQVLLQEMTPPQVERVMGPNQTVTKLINGQPLEVVEKAFDWPELTRDQVFEMVDMRVRAGTTGAPDKIEQQETWTKVLPLVQGLVVQITQISATGGDAAPFEALLRETLARFDERLDVEQFLPPKKPAQPPTMPAMPGAPQPQAQGIPPQLAALMGGAQNLPVQ